MTGGDARLLVVVPHATRTGSTRVLLDLLRGLPSVEAAAAAGRGAWDGPIGVAVRLLSDGPMRAELEAMGAALEPREVPGAVLANSTLSAGAILEYQGRVPTAVYVHETADVLETLPDDARRGLLGADRVLAVSPLVRADLVAFGVAADRITDLPPLVGASSLPTVAAVAAVRESLGLATTDRLALGCGEAAWRKGVDLFLAMAAQLTAVPDLHFAWVGRSIRSLVRQLQHDVDSIGIGPRMHWVGDVADARPYLAAADVLVMPSRSDPQPLVPLEAAQVGTPTAAFAVGGLAELGLAGAALTVPFPDARGLAGHVLHLLERPDDGAFLAAAGRRWIEERQSPEVLLPRFRRFLVDLLGSSPAMLGE